MIRRIVLIVSVTAWIEGAFASDLPLTLTLENYTAMAVEKGVKAKENEWSLEQAGYTQDVVMRETALPNFTLGQTHFRGETITNGSSLLTDSNHTNLTMNEKTPLGTALSVTGEYGNSTVPTTVGRPSMSASVSQPIYLFVKNATGRQRQQASLAFAEAQGQYQSTALSIRSQAHSLYYNVMLGEESIKVQQRKLNSTQKLLDVTQALVQAGRSAPIEVMRSKIRLQVDQSALENAIALRDQAILAAKNFAFLPLDQPVTFASHLEFAPFQIPVDRLIDFALLHQPNLEVLRRADENARLNYQAAVEPTRPAFTVGGTYNDQEYPGTLLTHSWTWTGGMSWMFFDSFVTSAEARSARIGEWVADLNLTDGERTARVNIRNAYINLKNAEKQIQDFELSLDQAKRNVDVVRLRFQNGLDRLIDVFDAENDMRDLDNQYLTLLVQFNQNKDQISELIGADVDTLR